MIGADPVNLPLSLLLALLGAGLIYHAWRYRPPSNK